MNPGPGTFVTLVDQATSFASVANASTWESTAGSAAAARSYVESDHSRADDYYLAEGSGLAEHYIAGPGTVQRVGGLDGPTYERWVAGYDVLTGAAKGRLRDDARALRFVDVVVNGPKSWSLAAALHPDIATPMPDASCLGHRPTSGGGFRWPMRRAVPVNLSLGEAAEAMSVSVKTIRLWIAAGTLSAYCRGKRAIRIRLEALEARSPLRVGDSAELRVDGDLLSVVAEPTDVEHLVKQVMLREAQP